MKKNSKYTISRRHFLKINTGLIFTTALASEAIGGAIVDASPKLRFGLVTDSHYAERPKGGTRYYQESLEKMKECVEVMNTEKVNFMIHLGDFKDENPDDKSQTLDFLKTIESAYSQFEGNRYHAIGNHDVDSITKQQFLQNIENTNIDKSASYYSFDNNGYHFVVLDANYDEKGNDHFYESGNANWQITNIPKKERRWLKRDLRKTDKPTIVFIHHLLFDSGEKHRYHVQEVEKIRAILEKSGKVQAVFQGHIHKEIVQNVNNIHYYTQYGMVDYSGLSNNSFSIVEIYDKHIEIKGYKRVGNHKLG